MSNRRVGLELEVCGQTFCQASSIIEKCSLSGWNTHEDASIPKVYTYGSLAKFCHEPRVCSYCDRNERDCSCCSCPLTCTKCNNTYTYQNLVAHQNCPNYACRMRGGLSRTEVDGLLESRGKCTCSFSSRSYAVDCDCSDDRCDGVEIVSPATNDYVTLEKDLNIIYKELINNAQNSGHHFSSFDDDDGYGDYSTGYHVHVESEDLTLEQKGLLVLYVQTHFEELQRKWPDLLPDWRRDWRYTHWVTCYHEDSLHDFSYRARHGERYKAVNITGNKIEATVEFRIAFMPSTAEEAFTWMEFCRDLVDNVSTFSAFRSANAMESLEAFEAHMLSQKTIEEIIEVAA
jgi:hypothetical protein